MSPPPLLRTIHPTFLQVPSFSRVSEPRCTGSCRSQSKVGGVSLLAGLVLTGDCGTGVIPCSNTYVEVKVSVIYTVVGQKKEVICVVLSYDT